jgi:hypothetical protein
MDSEPRFERQKKTTTVNVLLVEPEHSPKTTLQEPDKDETMYPGRELYRHAEIILRSIFAVFGTDRQYIIDIIYPQSIRQSYTNSEDGLLRDKVTRLSNGTWVYIDFKGPWTSNFLMGREETIRKYDCIFFSRPLSWTILFGSKSEEDIPESIIYRFKKATKQEIVMMVLDRKSRITVADPNDKFSSTIVPWERKLRETIRLNFDTRIAPDGTIYLVKFPRRPKRHRIHDYSVIPASKKICRMVCEEARTAPLPDCRRVTTLSGPRTLRYHKIFGRRILLLGEIHNNAVWAPESKENQEIHSWLAEMGAYAPECLDIMVEHAYWQEPGLIGFPTRSSLGAFDDLEMKEELDGIETLRQMNVGNAINGCALTAVMQTFAPCEFATRLNCYGVNLRYTNIDVRDIFWRNIQNPSMQMSSLPLILQLKVEGWYHPLESTILGSSNLGIGKLSFPDAFSMHAFFENICKYVVGFDDNLKHHYIKLVNLVIDSAVSLDPTISAADLDAEKDHSYMIPIIAMFKKARAKTGMELANKILNLLIDVEIDQKYNNWKQVDCHMGFILHIFMMDYYTLLKLFTMFDKNK